LLRSLEDVRDLALVRERLLEHAETELRRQHPADRTVDEAWVHGALLDEAGELAVAVERR
jgi:hypothetical protein